MLVVVVLDPRAPLPRQLRWALNLATARAASLVCLLPVAGAGAKANSEGSDNARQKALPHLRQALEGRSGFRVIEDSDDDPPEEGRTVALELVRPAGDADAILHEAASRGADLLVLVLGEGDLEQALARDGGREILQRASCSVVALRLGSGEKEPGPDVLVPVSRGPIFQAALRLGRDLTAAAGGKLTAVFVEPPIGSDAELVGQRVLDGIVTRALGKDHGDVVEHVVIDAAQQDGVLRACEEDRPGVVLLGTSRFAGLGERDISRVARQVLRRRPDLDVAIVRAALPVTNRLRQWIEAALQRTVPQLEREQRVSLAERVQSSSAWDVDFVALISLSTLIAAMGLVQDSVAVVIGAMLVAPLMTPILGVGLALVHGNIALARIASRSILYGVVTALVLGVLVGTTHPGLVEPTREMLARSWPHPMDLLVAFVSGVAAAYATSRPNLLSALPGVAIAASLVPPLATSGLFAALGYGTAALGAFLLFLTNMVAIVLAAALALWAVGIRSVKGASRWTRVVGNGLITVALLLALYLGLAPEHDVRGRRVPQACTASIRAHVEPAFRLVAVTVLPARPTAELVVRIAGSERPDADMTVRLGELARPHFADPIRVRLVADWEALEPTSR